MLLPFLLLNTPEAAGENRKTAEAGIARRNNFGWRVKELLYPASGF